MEKHKRSTPSSLPLYVARFVFIMAVIFAGLTYFRSDFLYNIYATLAGIIVLTFWIIVAVSMTMILIWNQYRLHGQNIKAKATLMVLFSMLIVLVSALSFALTGF